MKPAPFLAKEFTWVSAGFFIVKVAANRQTESEEHLNELAPRTGI